MKKTILIIILFALCVSISSAGITDKLRAVIAAKNAGGAGDFCDGLSSPDFCADWVGAGADDELCSSNPCNSTWDSLLGTDSEISVAGNALVSSLADTGTYIRVDDGADETETYHEFVVQASSTTMTGSYGQIAKYKEKDSSPVNVTIEWKIISNSWEGFKISYYNGSGTSFDVCENADGLNPVAETPYRIKTYYIVNGAASDFKYWIYDSEDELICSFDAAAFDATGGTGIGEYDLGTPSANISTAGTYSMTNFWFDTTDLNP